ncbi:MAG: chemotaxis response regulator protein-glutamate methylesterase [Gammaproteobacteria bacterium]|nr:chemotaxis response regulator protein-glutamate methylesterase [Gammaproteobacteria bacterium]
MPIKVLVVDDSSFFRRRVSEILNADPDLTVIDTAENGQQAVEKALSLKPDIVVMDIEMPVMDGITAVRQIMAKSPRPIMMFSSLTHDGARATLDALEAGALDFMPKRFEEISRDRNEAGKVLQQRVKALARSPVPSAPRPAMQVPPPPRPAAGARPAPVPTPSSGAAAPRPLPVAQPLRSTGPAKGRYQLVAIGTSTGGPVALHEVLTRLPKDFPLPIIIIQHMPASFTPAFAKRLDTLCQIQVKEGADGDDMRPGVAYIAPGGKQMVLDGNRLRVRESDERLTYKPCVDVTFASAAKALPGKVLAIVLTGMGADGRDGSRLLKQGGATVWAQDETSCVVYGMPMSVVKAGLADEVLSLDNVAARMMEVV